MADQPTTPSSSPSEPDPDEAATAEAPATVGEPTTTGRPTPAPPTNDTPDADERRQRLRSRAILAGAATALTLGGGLTGFVIGHSTAGDDDLRPANFSRQGPGGDGRFHGPPGPPDRGTDGRPDGSGPGSSDDPT
jgi:hypothetical protein